MKNFVRFFLPLAFITTACGIYNFDSAKTGAVGIAVKWPVYSSLKIQTIPNTTVKIKVNVTGEGLDSNTPITGEIIRPKDRLKLSKIPVGKKHILVEALDSQDKTVAKGESDASVTVDSLTTVEVELNPIQAEKSIPKIEIGLPSSPNNSIPNIQVVVDPANNIGPSSTVASLLPGRPNIIPSILNSINPSPLRPGILIPTPSATPTVLLPNPSGPPRIELLTVTPVKISGGNYPALLSARIVSPATSIHYKWSVVAQGSNITGTFPVAPEGDTAPGLQYMRWVSPIVASDTNFDITLTVNDTLNPPVSQTISVVVKGGTGSTAINNGSVGF